MHAEDNAYNVELRVHLPVWFEGMVEVWCLLRHRD